LKVVIEPMVKKYATDSQRNEGKGFASPSAALVQHLLNYSKALEVKKVKHKKVLLNLN
jgi:hypothetical protein